ncbi:hypothetical protein PInf_024700 [Phytophthora infestans]|nr:hypothetical protein PInf_024700 [Phytophthora infestans]
MVAALRLTVALIGFATAFVTSADEYFEGDGTSYTLGQVSSGNCNFMSAIPSASDNYVAVEADQALPTALGRTERAAKLALGLALNQAQWDNLAGCGRCIEVSCIDEQCTAKNKTAVVQVLDRCPKCAHGALDLSPTVYKKITGLDPNRLTMRWRFVDCPDPGTVQVCLKEGSNANWIAVQPTNGLVGVQSVTVNGASTKMLDGAYYYVATTSNADLLAVKVAITSVNGDEISGTYSLTAGKCTDTKKQFGGDSTSQSQSYPATSAPAPTTAAPKATTAAPTATTATPSATSPTQTYSSGTSEESSQTGQSLNEQGSQSSQSGSTAQYEQSSQSDATQASSSASTTPEATPAAPESTPVTQQATPATPEAATDAPTSTAPEGTTAFPDVTNAPTEAPAPSGDTSKCHVRSRRHRN